MDRDGKALSTEECCFFFVCVGGGGWGLAIRVEVAVERISGLTAMILVSFSSVTR